MVPAKPRKIKPGLIFVVLAVVAAAIVYGLLAKRGADTITSVAGAPVEVRQPPPVPDANAGSHDWENSGAATDPRFDQGPIRASEITSSRTLAQTTRWLRWAILQYGDSTTPMANMKNIDVVFGGNGCLAQWTKRARIGDTNRFEDTVTAMDLAKMDLGWGDIMTSQGEVTLQTSRAPNATVTEKFWVQSSAKLTPDGDRSSPQGIVYIDLAHREGIENRVAWALIHAAKLCGATASP